MTDTPNEVDVQVGIRIRQRRQVFNVSQEKLALACGVSFQQIQKYERGTNRVSASRLSQIAAALECSVAYLLGETEAATFPVGTPAEREVALFMTRRDMTSIGRALLDLSPDSRVLAIGTITSLLASIRTAAGLPPLVIRTVDEKAPEPA